MWEILYFKLLNETIDPHWISSSNKTNIHPEVRKKQVQLICHCAFKVTAFSQEFISFFVALTLSLTDRSLWAKYIP